jgi:gamma-glutamyl phosphate reductase
LRDATLKKAIFNQFPSAQKEENAASVYSNAIVAISDVAPFGPGVATDFSTQKFHTKWLPVKQEQTSYK